MKNITIFFSWQSDLEPKATRYIIEEAINKAKKHLEEIVIIEADRDTKGQTGSQNIEEVIFSKIRNCDIFVADVSIVNKYIAKMQSSSDEGDTIDANKAPEIEGENVSEGHKIRFTPNPNVMEELGYAAAIVGWHNVICIMNTDYGKEEDLPFDLSHHRITDYSLKTNNKAEIIKELRDIIVSHVLDLLENGLRQKSTNADHIVGYYDLDKRILVESLAVLAIPDLPFVEAFKSEKVKTIRNLIETIKNIDVPIVIPIKKKDEQGSLVVENENQPHTAIQKFIQADYFKALNPPRDLISIEPNDRKLVEAYASKILNEELDEKFFSLGNMYKNPFHIAGVNDYYEGTLEEKKKYEKLNQLVEEIIADRLFDAYLSTFETVRLYPLAICNKSKNPDQNLTVTLIVENGETIVPTKDFIAESLKNKFEGRIYNLGFVKGLFELPETGDISDNVEHETVMPRMNGIEGDPLGGYHFAGSNENDYEDELKQYILSPIKDSNEYKINVSSLRPNEKSWLGIIALKDDGSSPVIKYRIWSENTDGTIEGMISNIDEQG